MVVPLYVSREDAKRLIEPSSVLRVIERALAGLATGLLINGTKGGFTLAGQDGQRHMGAISGCDLEANVGGVKWFAACDENPRRGLPRVPSTIVLCDADTGILVGIVDATSLTAARTAALAVCAIRRCVPCRLRKATIVGFGGIGRAIMQYMLEHFEIDEIVVASRNGAAADVVKATMCPGQSRLSVESRLEHAVRGADLVVTATGLSKNMPLVDASWLESDVTVCGLGSYQEIDGRVALAADRIFVDNWEACRQRGNLAPIIQSGALAREAIDGEVPDLVAGKLPGRSPNDGTILIALVGIGALDIALGAELLRLARSRGVGRALV